MGQTEFEQLVAILRPDDALVLMDDGVYLQSQLHHAPCPCYVMQAHRQMRGLASAGATVDIDMDTLVTLTEQHNNSASW